ncbi:Poly [ADP-ribose] polymerase 3 [Aphanomyces cochlioides]|nr:Poly [ADP-ribose] polymerase 3 [Aphanomyces cochlioides]
MKTQPTVSKRITRSSSKAAIAAPVAKQTKPSISNRTPTKAVSNKRKKVQKKPTIIIEKRVTRSASKKSKQGASTGSVFGTTQSNVGPFPSKYGASSFGATTTTLGQPKNGFNSTSSSATSFAASSGSFGATSSGFGQTLTPFGSSSFGSNSSGSTQPPFLCNDCRSSQTNMFVTTANRHRLLDSAYHMYIGCAINHFVWSDFHVKLHQDVGFGAVNFFHIQIIFAVFDLWTIFTRWGRSSENGEFKIVSTPSLISAIKEFEKIFKEKTDNEWKDRHNFVLKQGFYQVSTLPEHPIRPCSPFGSCGFGQPAFNPPATTAPAFGGFSFGQSTPTPAIPGFAAQTNGGFSFGQPAPTSTPMSANASGHRLDEVYAKSMFGSSTHSVYRDYDVMLNQVNITATTSNNKFYRIQLIQTSSSTWDVFTRWGRVGEDGKYKRWCPTSDLNSAINVFKQKFHDKTKNNWEDRKKFQHKKGYYEIVELDLSAGVPAEKIHRQIGDDSVPSTLAPPTQKLIQMIFDKDMFKNELVRMNLDPKRMPLGTLSIKQIQKGVAILDDLQASLDGGNPRTSTLQTLSAKFYQLIPHAYPRHVIPPVLNTPVQLKEKYQMLSTLHDIVVAQDVEKALGESEPVKQNSLDLKYAELNSQLDLVTPDNPLYKVIQAYIANTNGQYPSMSVLDIWEVRRSDEDKKFSKFASTPNHRLLWHGTNVAVVAAILKSGLRIMPSSGGRVGKGIYLANMLAKSRQYVRAAHFGGQNVGCLFLVEAALGKMNEIRQDDSSLTFQMRDTRNRRGKKIRCTSAEERSCAAAAKRVRRVLVRCCWAVMEQSASVGAAPRAIPKL